MSGIESILARSFDPVAYTTLAIAPMVFVVLFYIQAPYGRHIRRGWGPMLDNRLGWFIMESPAVLVFGSILLAFSELNTTPILLLLVWQMHYCHRAFIYPWTLKRGSKMPWLILLMAIVFNTSNGYLNAWSIASQADKYSNLWLTSPQFLIGVAVFFCGMAMNKGADKKLRKLSLSGQGYQIPRGGLYRWVSCPNYLGEIIQWIGWAIATWSLAGWIFAIWTMANLVPRAIAHHRWYRETFADYPEDRRALIPHVL